MDPQTRTMLPPDTIRARFAGAGIDLDRPIVTSCGSGVTAAVLAYNAFTRVNRLVLYQLDGFAHDLHAFLTVGARVPTTP